MIKPPAASAIYVTAAGSGVGADPRHAVALRISLQDNAAAAGFQAGPLRRIGMIGSARCSR